MAYGFVNVGSNGTVSTRLNELETSAELSSAAHLESSYQHQKHKQYLDNLVPQIGEISLSNTQSYPFNDSAVTVAMKPSTATTDYRVEVEVLSGDNVGDIKIYDKQINGFKLAYTGSCPLASLKYFVIGGY